MCRWWFYPIVRGAVEPRPCLQGEPLGRSCNFYGFIGFYWDFRFLIYLLLFCFEFKLYTCTVFLSACSLKKLINCWCSHQLRLSFNHETRVKQDHYIIILFQIYILSFFCFVVWFSNSDCVAFIHEFGIDHNAHILLSHKTYLIGGMDILYV